MESRRSSRCMPISTAFVLTASDALLLGALLYASMALLSFAYIPLRLLSMNGGVRYDTIEVYVLRLAIIASPTLLMV